MKLYVMRHGEAVDAEAVGGVDEARSLTAEGAELIRKAATALSRLGVEPDMVLTSPALRALQTANLVRETLTKGKLEICDELAPGAIPEKIAGLIQARGAASMLLIGHNPDLEDLIHYLLRSGTGGSLTLKKGGVALLRVERPVGPGTGQLQQMWTPKYLANLAG